MSYYYYLATLRLRYRLYVISVLVALCLIFTGCIDKSKPVSNTSGKGGVVDNTNGVPAPTVPSRRTSNTPGTGGEVGNTGGVSSTSVHADPMRTPALSNRHQPKIPVASTPRRDKSAMVPPPDKSKAGKAVNNEPSGASLHSSDAQEAHAPSAISVPIVGGIQRPRPLSASSPSGSVNPGTIQPSLPKDPSPVPIHAERPLHPVFHPRAPNPAHLPAPMLNHQPAVVPTIPRSDAVSQPAQVPKPPSVENSPAPVIPMPARSPPPSWDAMQQHRIDYENGMRRIEENHARQMQQLEEDATRENAKLDLKIAIIDICGEIIRYTGDLMSTSGPLRLQLKNDNIHFKAAVAIAKRLPKDTVRNFMDKCDVRRFVDDFVVRGCPREVAEGLYTYD